jgi:hypothetical protein
MVVQDMDLVRHWARRYYELNLNPLPSSGKAKRPAMDGSSIRKYREERIPEAWLKSWWSPNIQIPLGVRWGYCVIDIDGAGGMRRWLEMKGGDVASILGCWVAVAPEIRDAKKCYDRSRHLWFRLPEDMDFFRTIHLWKSDAGHDGLSVLGDGSLAVVPPSIHPQRKTRYEWLVGPDDREQPSLVPSWILVEIGLVLSQRAIARIPRVRPRPSGLNLPAVKGRRYMRDEVLYALGDRKHEIAQAYGLEVRQHPNSAGFYECRAVDRDDNRWSCTIDPRTGVYRDWATGETISFFDLLMKLDPGTFPKFPVAVNKLGAYALGGSSCPR